MKTDHQPLWCGLTLIAATVTLLSSPATLAGQKPSKKPSTRSPASVSAVDPKLKGIWEAVNYPADVYLNDVFFVTPEIGWVAAGAHGRPGMILSTRNGGETWEAQLGDPESSEPAYHDLRFIDATHGWVLQDATAEEYKLLQTSDGQSWSQVGSIKREWGVPDYAFISEREGVYVDGNDNVSRIMRTADGGRTWTEAFACKATLEVEGLTKNVDCALKTLHFPTPSVGYALGAGYGAKRTLFVAKTGDGGKTWKLLSADVGSDLENSFKQEAFFTSETDGVAHLSETQLYRTSDGGQTWKGVVATPGPVIRFADPMVGWTFSSYRTLNYTTDGGNRWATRELPFPAAVAAFSLPRRDRAFVVGDHGMVYRYRLVPVTAPAVPKAITAPAMPAFDTPLDDRVGELDTVLNTLAAQVAASPEPTAGAPAASDAPAAVEETELAAGDATAPLSPFTQSCCSKPLSSIQLLSTAVTTLVPQFLATRKNANLLLTGMQMLNDLPGGVRGLNTALRAFQRAPDRAAAEAALAQVLSAVTALKQSTAVAFQKQPTVGAPGAEGSSSGAAPVDVGASPTSTPESTGVIQPNESAEVETEIPQE